MDRYSGTEEPADRRELRAAVVWGVALVMLMTLMCEVPALVQTSVQPRSCARCEECEQAVRRLTDRVDGLERRLPPPDGTSWLVSSARRARPAARHNDMKLED